MAFDILKSVEIIDLMENYIASVRPAEEIKSKLDLSYKIENQSIILFEIRPDWQDPTIIRNSDYAKTTYVKSDKCWKIFWMRASGKWESYPPNARVNKLEDFLNIVDKDEYGCFKG